MFTEFGSFPVACVVMNVGFLDVPQTLISTVSCGIE